MHSIILNFLPISLGGGLQNSLSFIKNIKNFGNGNIDSLVAVVRRNSFLHKLCRKSGLRVIPIGDSVRARLQFEINCRSYFSYGQVCFTIFGPSMLTSANYLLNVNGCAYSNLFYTEIQFWSFLKGLPRFKKEMIDWYRRIQMRRADYWIFETRTLQRRAIDLFGFPKERVGVVPMAPSSFVSPERVNPHLREQLNALIPKKFRFLFLNSAHPNKRLHLLPTIAEKMISLGASDFVFVTTMDSGAPYANKVFKMFSASGLKKHIYNIGTVSPDQVATLIDCVDVICTFSILESFSNNFVEAWKMGRPLLVTEGDWSRDACGKSACYLNPQNCSQAARIMSRVIDDSYLRKELVNEGRKRLMMFPSVEEKVHRYFEQIEKARILGPCTNRVRREIKWKPKELVA